MQITTEELPRGIKTLVKKPPQRKNTYEQEGKQNQSISETSGATRHTSPIYPRRQSRATSSKYVYRAEKASIYIYEEMGG
mmetsp:Transcript_4677/g.8891  ORF Transcript_4677/g.8891 Transcript_4677/m.8891 type:complete len:80 (-) Transcript_4677:309-548(-)